MVIHKHLKLQGADNSNDSTTSTTASDNSNISSSSKDTVRFVNTKIEIDEPLKAFAQQYGEKTG